MGRYGTDRWAGGSNFRMKINSGNSSGGATSGDGDWYNNSVTADFTKNASTATVAGYPFREQHEYIPNKTISRTADGYGTFKSVNVYGSFTTTSTNSYKPKNMSGWWNATPDVTTALTYTVAFNANGGSGAPGNQTKKYGTALTLSSTKPTRSGYTFKGWGTSASTTTVTYAAGATYLENAAITLYAVWEANYGKVRYRDAEKAPIKNSVGDGPKNWGYGVIAIGDASAGTLRYYTKDANGYFYRTAALSATQNATYISTESNYTLYEHTVSYTSTGSIDPANVNEYLTRDGYTTINDYGFKDSSGTTYDTNSITYSVLISKLGLGSSTNTTLDLLVNWLEIASYTVYDNLKYNGSYQTGVTTTSASMVVDGNVVDVAEAKDIGTYTVDLYPFTGCAWADRTNGVKTVTYNIIKGDSPMVFDTTESSNCTYGVTTRSFTKATGAAGTVTYSLISAKLNNVDNSNITLSGNTVTIPVADVGSIYTVVIRATDPGNDNYNSKTIDKTFTITVKNKRVNPIEITTPQSGSLTFSTGAQDKAFTGATNAQGTVTYSISSQKDSSESSVTYFSVPTNTTASFRTAASTPAGTYTIVIKASAAGNTNYNSSNKEITYTLTINRAPGSVTLSSTSGSITYPATTTTFTATGTGTLSVSTSNSNVATASISGSTVTVTRTGYGSATITVSAAQSTNYNAASATYSVSCYKATPSVSASVANPTYAGSAVTLASATSSNCTYYLGYATSQGGTVTWLAASTSITSATSGIAKDTTYYIYYKATGNTNYYDIGQTYVGTAKYTYQTYTVSYNAGDATSGSAPAAQTKTYGSNLTLQSNSGSLAHSNTTHANNKAGQAITLTYDLNGGTSAAIPNNTGTGVTIPGSYTRSYTASGWGTSSGTTTKAYDFGGTYTSNGGATLYPAWTTSNGTTTYTATSATVKLTSTTPTKPNTDTNVTITISYNANGGSGQPSASTGTAVNTTPYTFNKWAAGSTGGTQYASNADYTESITGSKTVKMYALWDTGTTTRKSNPSITLGAAPTTVKANTDTTGTITVSYNANGGTGAPSASTGTYTNTTPYTFGGWNTLANGTGTNYNASTAYTFSSNTTLYAKWNAGTTTRKSNPSITLSSTTPTRTGYTFKGWSTSSTATTASYSAGTAYEFSSNTTLYAVWEINSYYLDLNGYLESTTIGTYSYSYVGGISPAGTADVYINGTIVSDDTTDFWSAIPYGSSYEFKDIKANTGWTYNGVYSSSLTGTIPTNNVCTYLQYTRNIITVTLNHVNGTNSTAFYYKYGANNGTHYFFSDNTLKTGISSVTVPVRTGYTFNGYYYGNTQYIAANGTISTSLNSVSSNITLTASWTANELTFGNETKTTSYSTSAQTLTVGAASNGTGTYSYALGSNSSSCFSFNTSTRVLTLAAGTTAGTYYAYVTATDSNSGKTKTKTITWTVNAANGTLDFGTTESLNITYGSTSGTITGASGATGSISYSLVSSTYNGSAITGVSVNSSNGTISGLPVKDVSSTAKFVITVRATSAEVTGKYNSKSIDKAVTITVIKANQTAPTIAVSSTIPTYPNSASAYVSANGTAAGTLTWENQTRYSAGSQTARAYYAATSNYNASGWSNSVTVTVKAATITVSAPNQAYTYDGGAHGSAITATTVNSQTATIKYGTTSGTYNLDSAPTITNVNDSKTIYYQVTAPNHDTKIGSYGLIINKLSLTHSSPCNSWDYDGANHTPGETGWNAIYMGWTGTWQTTEAGNYTYTVYLKDKDNTQWSDGTTDNKSYNWAIRKVASTMELSSTAATKYTGTSIDISAYVANNNGTVSYAFNSNGTTTASTISGATVTLGAMSTSDDNNQTVKVNVTDAGDNNHNSKTLVFTITVVKYTPSFNFDNTTSYVNQGSTLSIKASASASGGTIGTISYSLDKTTYATLSGTTVSGNKYSGTTTTTATATLTRTSTVKAASITRSFTVNDATAPTPAISGGTGLKSTSQTLSISASDNTNGSGISKYYWGTDANGTPSTAWTGASTAMTAISTSTFSGNSATYYLRVSDAAGNIGSTNITLYKYGVNNLLETATGTAGTYTSANYTSASSGTYLVKSGTTLTLSSIYTNPNSTYCPFKGYSTGYSTTAATLSTTNPTVSAGTIYYMWFDRDHVTAPAISADLTYTGGSLSPTITNPVCSHSGATHYSVSGDNVANIPAGSYSRTFSLASTSYQKWTDNTIDAKTVSWSIKRAKTATASGSNLVYTGSAQTGVAGSYVNWNGTTSATNYGSYAPTATPDSNHAWSDGSTGAKTINWSIYGVVNVTYNGQQKKAIPYVRVNGVWKQTNPYLYNNG